LKTATPSSVIVDEGVAVLIPQSAVRNPKSVDTLRATLLHSALVNAEE